MGAIPDQPVRGAGRVRSSRRCAGSIFGCGWLRDKNLTQEGPLNAGWLQDLRVAGHQVRKRSGASRKSGKRARKELEAPFGEDIRSGSDA